MAITKDDDKCVFVLTAFRVSENLWMGRRGDSAMGELLRIQVLLSPDQAERFERFCEQQGYKKSTLIAKLIREHLDRSGFEMSKAAWAQSATQ